MINLIIIYTLKYDFGERGNNMVGTLYYNLL
jgi:hypothetical protein